MLVDTRVLDVTGNLETETILMDIDPDSFGHLMDVMTNMYSDTPLAVLREYSTNALDAHIAGGVKRPIEITLPTTLAPFLKIRDFGEGLDEKDIREIYSRYGASTKRGTNDAVGMLGIGCKSALAYTNQFAVTSVKNGIKSQISVGRDEEGRGTMKVVDSYEVDEEQGTEVSIPTKSYDDFAEIARNLFRFWDEGTVLVNGEAPERIDGMWLADDLLINRDLDESYIVMGNVPYPWADSPFRGYEVVAFVNIGDVSFAPSREALKYNTKTKAVIEGLIERVEVEKNQAIEKLITEATDAPSALRVYNEASGFYSGTAVFQGVEVPNTYDTGYEGVRFLTLLGAKRWRQRDYSWTRSYYSSLWPNTIFIEGFGNNEWSAYKRKKLDQWMDKQLERVAPSNYVVMPLNIPTEISDWIDKDQIVSWDVIDAEKIKIDRTGTPRSDRPQGSYKGYTQAGYQDVIEADTIDTSKPLFHVHKDRFTSTHVIKQFNDEFTLIVLPSNRVNKYVRDFPSSKEMHEFEAEKKAEFLATITNDDKLWMVVSNQGQKVDGLQKLDPSKLDDPALVQTIDLLKQDRKALATKARMFGYTPNGDAPDWKNPLEKYPMLNTGGYYGVLSATLSGQMKDHIYIYLNAAFAAEGQGN